MAEYVDMVDGPDGSATRRFDGTADDDPVERLRWEPAATHRDLLGEPVARLLARWSGAAGTLVAPIDPDLADTAEFCRHYGEKLRESANCVVVAGRREGVTRYAACVVLATTRADVNGVVRRLLDVRKASFAAMDDAVALTGMQYGGITPVGLPDGWRLLVAGEVAQADSVVVGSGIRGSKLRLPGAALLDLPGAELIADLAQPADR
jgi:prolyl-tRNA editing enzyme YbaK/EbsC (Cys-tRNA(Pro) deacylase)